MTAIVAGGASGLGCATAKRLSQEGCNVMIADLPVSNGAAVAQGISNAIFQPTDVRVAEDVEQCIQACKRKFGRLNILVNAAQVAVGFPLANIRTGATHKLRDFARTVDINVSGTFNMVRLCAGLMCENDPDPTGTRGVIVNTASIVAEDGNNGQSAYAASKAAVASMTLPLARDLGPMGIRVVCLSPGLFDTSMTTTGLPEYEKGMLTDTIPFPPRLGHPDEFAHTVLWALTNPYLNGAVIRLDGGLRLLY